MGIMRITKAALAALAAIALLTLPIVTWADEVTEATVGFTAGSIIIQDPPVGSQGMHFNFGTGHTLPIVEEDAVYESLEGPNEFVIDDARAVPNGWAVDVSMTLFQLEGPEGEGQPGFSGTITLVNPYTLPSDDGITIGEVMIVGGAGDLRVMTATEEAGRGRFVTRWQESDVTLSVVGDELQKIMPGNHEAELTWKLVLGPVEP